MPSPFPGMDPFIEGQLWRNFHHNLIGELHRSLMARLRPHYGVFIEESVYLQTGDVERRLVAPDVLVADSPQRGGGTAVGTAVLTAPVEVDLPIPWEVRQAYLEIRRSGVGEVVTVIEVLSPTNKAAGTPGRQQYRDKADALLRSRTHLVEIDLLRGGERMPTLGALPPTDYCVLVSRAQRRPRAELWPIRLRDCLPPVPVPLAAGDGDLEVDLQVMFDRVYEGHFYEDLIRYDEEVWPPLDPEDAGWVREVIGRAQKGQAS
jgi:hypothetical protein